MVTIMRALGGTLCLLGIVGSYVCWQGVQNDEVYAKAVKYVERYPDNVLYRTEFKMAEPRHMLLLSGAWAAAPGGLVLGTICLGIASTLGAVREMRG